jgi:hypothetical protein
MRKELRLRRKPSKTTARAGLIIDVVLLLSPLVAYGDAWQIEPSVSFQQGYNDNFRLTDGNEDKVYTSRLVGAATLSRLTETMDINGIIRLDVVKYFGDTDNINDRPNQLAGFNVDKKWERIALGLKTLFQRDTVLRSTELYVDPENINIEPDQTVDNNIVDQNVRRIRTDISPSLTYNLTERSDLSLAYRYFNTHYSDKQGTDLDDFTQNWVNGVFSTQVTEKDRLLVLALGSHFNPDNGENSDNFELQTGFRHEFDETTNAGFTMGARHTRVDNPDGGTDTDNGFVARLQGEKRTGLTRYNARLERTLSPSGSGDQVQTTEANLIITRRLTEFLLFSVRSRAFENKSVGPRESGSSKRRWDIRPRLTWVLAPNWSLEGSYQYIRQKRFDSPDSVDSNAVFITLNYSLVSPLDSLK